MKNEAPVIRPGRLAAAWLLCIVCGCAGAVLWMPLYRWLGQLLTALPPMAQWQRALLPQIALYGSLFACIGAGIWLGVRLSRRFLSELELEVLFRVQRRD